MPFKNRQQKREPREQDERARETGVYGRLETRNRRTRNASAAVTGLSTTKHPLNNSVINSLGRLRRPVPPPQHSPSFRICPRGSETFAGIREEGACGSRSFHPPPFLLSLPLYSSLLTFNIRIFFSLLTLSPSLSLSRSYPLVHLQTSRHSVNEL